MPSMDEIPPPPSLSPEVASSTATSIHIRWAVSDLQPYTDSSGPIVIEGFRVHYQKVASTYVQYSHLLPPSAHSYSISNLVADTYYKVSNKKIQRYIGRWSDLRDHLTRFC